MNASIVVIGASLGGLSALRSVLHELPANYSVPVVIAQHRGQENDHGSDLLGQALSRFGPLAVHDAEDKGPVEAGKVFLAPAGYHLMLEDHHFALSTESVVSYARPSIDVLFESAAQAYGRGVVAVVLTGTGRDGADGARAVQAAGGHVLVQDPLEAEAPAMPRAVLAALGQQRGLPLAEIARELALLRPKGVLVHGRSRRREDLDRR